MNINTLVNELPDYVTGDLPVSLIKNAFQVEQSGKTTYYGKVRVRKALTEKDIANDLVVTGNNCNLSASEIIKVWNVITSAIIDRIANGYSVSTELGTYVAKINGCFESENDQFNKEKHSIGVSYHESKKLLSVLGVLKVLISMGHSTAPDIVSISDVKSKSSDKLTPNGFLSIEGNNLLITGEDANVGLHFINTSDSSKSVKLNAEDLGINTRTKLACVVPALEAGSYQIQVVTQYSKGKTLRKVAQESLLTSPFTVE